MVVRLDHLTTLSLDKSSWPWTAEMSPTIYSERDDWPKISIVTPNYNMAGYLEDTIRSVLNQNYPNLEYIIIDGGSSDGSIDIIKKYEKQLSFWVSEPDTGMYHAIQKGFEKSTGAIMAYINSDDMYHPNAFKTIVEAFNMNEYIQWVQGYGTVYDELGRLIFNSNPNNKSWSKYLYWNGYYQWIQQESTFWSRDLWEKAGGMIDSSYKYAGDMDLWSRFFRHGKLYNLPIAVAGFRKRRVGNLGRSNMSDYHKEAQEALKKIRQAISDKEKRRLNFVLYLYKAYKVILLRVGFLNAQGFYNKVLAPYLDLPPKIIFNRDTQKLELKD